MGIVWREVGVGSVDILWGDGTRVCVCVSANL